MKKLAMPSRARAARPMTTNTPDLRGVVLYAGGGGTADVDAGSTPAGGGGSDERGSNVRAALVGCAASGGDSGPGASTVTWRARVLLVSGSWGGDAAGMENPVASEN